MKAHFNRTLRFGVHPSKVRLELKSTQISRKADTDGIVGSTLLYKTQTQTSHYSGIKPTLKDKVRLCTD